jgi:hypothetical protein
MDEAAPALSIPDIAKCLELTTRRSVELTVNMIPPPRKVLMPKRNGPQLAGHTTNKPKADPEIKRGQESAIIRYRAGLQRDCTQMVDLL